MITHIVRNDRLTSGGFYGVDQPRATPDDARAAAFHQYVVPEIEVLMRVATTITRHHADAEDLVQDTLVRAYRAADRFDGAHPRAWLLTILRNTHINRNRRRRPELLDDPDRTEERHPTQAGLDADPATIVASRELDDSVARAFARLPEKGRQVVTLVDIDGLTYVEAAQALGLPEGTVMSRLHRARKQIRARLAATGVAPKPRRGMGR